MRGPRYIRDDRIEKYLTSELCLFVYVYVQEMYPNTFTLALRFILLLMRKVPG